MCVPTSERVEEILVAVVRDGSYRHDRVAVGPRGVEDRDGGWCVVDRNGDEVATAHDAFEAARYAAGVLEGMWEPDPSRPHRQRHPDEEARRERMSARYDLRIRGYLTSHSALAALTGSRST